MFADKLFELIILNKLLIYSFSCILSSLTGYRAIFYDLKYFRFFYHILKYPSLMI